MSIPSRARVFQCGNTALGMYCSSITGTAHLLITYGNEFIKKTFLEKMIAGEWGGTMCLTEPGAGSDVGALKPKRRDSPMVPI